MYQQSWQLLSHNTEEPVVMVNGTVWLEEGTQSCSVTVIRSYIKATHFMWQKDEEVINSELEQHHFSEKDVTFNNIKRNNNGIYSLTANMSCHEHSKPRKFVGTFSLNVVCKYLYCINLVLVLPCKKISLQFRRS